MDISSQWGQLLKEIIEETKKKLLKYYPGLSDAQLNDIITENKQILVDQIIQQINISLPSSIGKLDLPSGEIIEKKFEQKRNLARRYRTKFKHQKIDEALLTRDVLSELDGLREKYASENDTGKAAEYAGYKYDWSNASATMIKILDLADSDCSRDLAENQEADDKTRRMMRGIIGNDDK